MDIRVVLIEVYLDVSTRISCLHCTLNGYVNIYKEEAVKLYFKMWIIKTHLGSEDVSMDTIDLA